MNRQQTAALIIVQQAADFYRTIDGTDRAVEDRARALLSAALVNAAPQVDPEYIIFTWWAGRRDIADVVIDAIATRYEQD